MLKLQICNFKRSQDGAAAVEFAIVSLLFITFVMAILEFSRLLWVKQAISDVAVRAARCATVGNADSSISCRNDPEVNDFAIAEAAAVGILLVRDQVTADLGVPCNGYIANQVEITFHFNSPVTGLIPSLLQDISVVACYPASA